MKFLRQLLQRLPRRYQCILLITATLLALSLFVFFFIPDKTLQLVISDVTAPLFNCLATLALGLAAWQLRRVSRRLALAWAVLALAQLAFTLGDVFWAVLELIYHTTPYPSIADGPYLLFYPLFFLGIVLLPLERKKTVEWVKHSLDISIVMIVAALLYWVFLIDPLLVAKADVSFNEMFLSVAYPVGDLMLIFAVLVILYYHARRMIQGPIWLIGLALGVMVVTDSFYTYQSLLGSYAAGGLLDLGWIGFFVLITAAGVYQALTCTQVPRVAALPDRSGRSGASGVLLSNVLTYLPYAWVGAAYLVMMQVLENPELRDDITALLVGVGLILALLLTRQVITINENDSLVTALGKTLEQVKQQAVELDQSNVSLREEISERTRIEDKLSYDALHDGLTGLSNRVMFMSRLEHALDLARRGPEKQSAILFLDLDNFKAINDGLGHTAGDTVLVEVAPRLLKCVRSCDTVARFGGDEFAILLENTAELESVFSVARRLMDELARPFLLKGIEVSLTCSIGVIQTIGEYEQCEEIMRDVDIAMYQAKKKGKACCEIFQLNMRESAFTRLTIENDLRRGILAGEFELYYQPIYTMLQARIVGVEALARWNHPQRGLLLPAEFIEVAEKTGLIHQLGEWVLEKACTQLQRWRQENPQLGELLMYVNISGKQISREDFQGLVSGVIARTGVDPHKLRLEITENAFIENQAVLKDLLVALREVGIAFVIDDFGTGYSSLAYLKHMPVTTIKIDRSFVKDIPEDAKDFEIIKAIVSMAQGLGINTVAEGIETAAQLGKIKDLDCTFGQGFHLSRPMNVEKIQALLGAKTTAVD
jgi:diguanylate cyclase (GGDEF)-like protein